MAEKSGVSGRGRALVLVIFGREKEKELVWRWRRKKERKKNAREKGCFLRGFAFWRLPGESFGGEKQAEKTGHLLEKEEDIESRPSSCRKKKKELPGETRKQGEDESGCRRDWSEFHVHLDSYASLSFSRFGLFCIARLVDF